MKKFLKRNYLGILKKLLILAVIILLLILIFGFIQDLFDQIDILIKKIDQQMTHIQALEQEVSSLETANAKLHNLVTYQHEQIQELEYKLQGNTMSFNLQPKEMTVEDVHKEIEPQLHTVSNAPTIAAGILTGVMMLRTVMKLVVPAIP